MRKLADIRILVLTGVSFVVCAVALFFSSLPFAIPSVTAACGQPPPDVRMFTSGEQVRQFLSACGDGGRAAYQNLQLADLFYPAVCGLFLATALAMTLTRFARPDSRIVALAALPLVGSAFDYLENAAAWVAITNYPADGGPSTDLLGFASIAKQAFSWAAWLVLVGALAVTVVRWGRRRLLRPAAESV